VSGSLPTSEIKGLRPEHAPQVVEATIAPAVETDQNQPDAIRSQGIASRIVGYCTNTMDGLALHHPGITALEAVPYKTSRLFDAAREDYADSDRKARTVAWGGSIIVSQVIDRFRVGFVLIPRVAKEVLDSTAAVAPTAAAAAGTFVALNFSVGEVLNRGIEHYPKTVEAVKKEFPSFVALFEQALPGMEMKQDESESNAEEAGLLRRFMSGASTHVKRAITGFTLGSTAFVATGAAQGRSRKERTKLNALTTMDTAVLVGGLGAGVAAAVLELPKRGHAWAAEKISSTVENSKIWWSLAIGTMALDYRANKKQMEDIAERKDVAILDAIKQESTL
jgi:hypothetical protein